MKWIVRIWLLAVVGIVLHNCTMVKCHEGEAPYQCAMRAKEQQEQGVKSWLSRLF